MKIGLARSRSDREGGLLKQETAQRMLTPVVDQYGLCVCNLRGGGHRLPRRLELNKTTSDLCGRNSKVAMPLFQAAEESLAEDGADGELCSRGQRRLQSIAGKSGVQAGRVFAEKWYIRKTFFRCEPVGADKQNKYSQK